jgi:histidinol phosphatase-like enzyme
LTTLGVGISCLQQQRLLVLPHQGIQILQDGTLIVQKSNARYATSASDWKFFNTNVPKKVKQFYDDGYKVVVFR